MIYRDKTNNHIEAHKKALRLTGDVYVVDRIHIASLESHKAQFPNSTATTIEEAEAEYLAYRAEAIANRPKPKSKMQMLLETLRAKKEGNND